MTKTIFVANFRDFESDSDHKATVRKIKWFPQNSNLFLLTNFSIFQQSKRTLETTETKQADSKLGFTTKIIKIYLLVFANELIGDAMRVSKQCQK